MGPFYCAVTILVGTDTVFDADAPIALLTGRYFRLIMNHSIKAKMKKNRNATIQFKS